MTIYDKECKDFHNNGLGFLKDCISAYVEEEINSTLKLTIEYPINGQNVEYLVYDNIIKCNTSRYNDQLFIIKSIVKNFRTLTITALHIFYILKENHIEDIAPTNLAPEDFGNWILQRTNFPNNFIIRSNITNKRASARYVNKNPVECLIGEDDNSLINLFNCEIDRDNFTITITDKIGEDNHVKLIIGKNIKNIQINTDATEIYTRIYPQGYDGLTLPEKYVDSELINSYPTPKVGSIEFSDIKYDPNDEESYHTVEEAYQAIRDRVKLLFDSGVDKPSINVKIDWLELSKTKEYYDMYSNLERVNLGDIITAQILGLNYTTRIIKVKYNVLTDTIDNFEIGSSTMSISSTLNNLHYNVESISPSSILDQAKKSATEALNNALGGYILKTQNELFIMDTDNPATAKKVWRWNINGLGYSNNGIDGPYELAMTQDGQIVADFITTGKLNTDVIEGYNELLLVVKSLEQDISKISSIEINIDNIIQQIKNFNDQSENIAKLQMSIEKIEQSIGSITDMTTSSETMYGSVELSNVHESEPIAIVVRPSGKNISYLYPFDNLYPSTDLFMSVRTIRFVNKTTEEIVDYELPDDLLYLDENTYDEFRLDYENKICQIIKKLEIDLDKDSENYGKPKRLSQTQIIDYEYPNIFLSSGDYSITLLGYETGYLYVRLMVSNIYTSQFATVVELHSSISQTATSITESVNAQFHDVNGEINEVKGDVSLKIDKGDTGEIISALNVAVNQLVITSDNFMLSKDGTITAKAGIIGGCSIINGVLQIASANITNIDASKITSGTLSADRISGGTIDASKINIKNISASSITSGTLSADRISGGTIDASKINIKNISASSITSGTFSANRISGGSINASNIICGTYVKIYSGGHLELTTNAGFFAMGPAYGNVPSITHPYVSALNICYGSGLGISFRSSQSITNIGSSMGYIRCYQDSSRGATYQMNIWGEDGVEIASNASIYLWSKIELNASGSSSVWAKGNGLSSARIQTTAGSASSKILKENIKEFNRDDYSEAYNLLKQIQIYNYDYKYKLYKDKHQYGFIIDDIEEIPNYSKFFKFETLYAKVLENNILDPSIMEDKNFDKNNLPNDIISYKQYDSNVLDKFILTCLKTLQDKIEDIENKIKGDEE